MIRAMAAVFLALSLPSCGSGTASEAGPLRLPQDYGFMAAPMATGSFHSFDVCAADRPTRVRVVNIRAGRLVGAARATFKVAWPRPAQALAAAGGLPLEPVYRAAGGASGLVRRCSNMAGPGMAIAVVLPPARVHAVLVRNVEVTYRVGDRQYTDVARVRLGTCASTPQDVVAQPPQCRPT